VYSLAFSRVAGFLLSLAAPTYWTIIRPLWVTVWMGVDRKRACPIHLVLPALDRMEPLDRSQHTAEAQVKQASSAARLARIGPLPARGLVHGFDDAAHPL
jgi:hypothetical protein